MHHKGKQFDLLYRLLYLHIVCYEYSFEVTGLDQAGPLYVRDTYDKHILHKCYIILFICAATRAVHLELSADQNTNSIMLAIPRYIARRGIYKLYISDNFKSFKTTEINSLIQEHYIKWEFILEKSPWWGGFYERLIGLTIVINENRRKSYIKIR